MNVYISWVTLKHYITTTVKNQLMTLTLQEIDHIIKALESMSSYDIARAREQIDPGVTEHDKLVDKLQLYRYRLTRP